MPDDFPMRTTEPWTHIMDRYAFARQSPGRVSALVHKDMANGALRSAVRQAWAEGRQAERARIAADIDRLSAEDNERGIAAERVGADGVAALHYQSAVNLQGIADRIRKGEIPPSDTHGGNDEQ